jgi:hypothetical protein
MTTAAATTMRVAATTMMRIVIAMMKTPLYASRPKRHLLASFGLSALFAPKEYDSLVKLILHAFFFIKNAGAPEAVEQQRQVLRANRLGSYLFVILISYMW